MISSSTKKKCNSKEVVPAELNMMKQVDTATDAPSRFEISPMEMTIEETLKLRADERRKKLKEFNSFIIMFLKLMSMKRPAIKIRNRTYQTHQIIQIKSPLG
jgi:hypothetical protein